jgi:hypothetical protein
MGAYFKPWRRKRGVVTLVMACASMAAWMRSWVIADEFEIPMKNGRSHFFVAGDNWIGWVVQRDGDPVIRLKKPIKMLTPPKKKRMSWISRRERYSDDQFARIQTNLDGSMSVVDNPNLFLPYWSIVIPLTLLSAYLLLSMPRKLLRSRVGEPVSEKAI